jgi:hypothetical protein
MATYRPFNKYTAKKKKKLDFISLNQFYEYNISNAAVVRGKLRCPNQEKKLSRDYRADSSTIGYFIRRQSPIPYA